MKGVFRADFGIAEDVGGEAERPGGEVHQRIGRGAEMGGPVRAADLVVNEGVDSFGVRHS
ncbi:hypothetical protein D3C86_2108450 [compost metagenome]